MAHRRPDPDELLRRVRDQESQARRGRLKIFFGASPGVGKTYAMLEGARAARALGLDVAVGIAETHGREETSRLLDGLEVLPRQRLQYRDTTLEEFDLDRALARRPALLLVDELAHTNVPGARHAKRWQDVEELLAAGINVWTTLNVQHVESLNDVVAQITGVRVRETVPDSILERADEVELADLTPDELLQRLREGKVYVPDQAARAIDQFFRKGNLIALRELALRRTAERVDAQMRGYMEEAGIRETWPASERVLACVGVGAGSVRLVRAARRIAERLGSPWAVVNVEAPGRPPTAAARAELARTLGLAEQLGAEVVSLTGEHPAEEILDWARTHNITRIVVGAPRRSRWPWLRRGMVDALVRGSEGIDVHVVTGSAERPESRPAPPPAGRAPWPQYLRAVLVPAALTLAALPLRSAISTIDAAMLFLLGVVFVSSRHSRGPATVASLLSIACFDFFFVPPFSTFNVSDVRFVLTFAVMLVVALVIGTLTGRIRAQVDAARERERRTAVLYAFSRDLASARTRPALARVTLERLHDLFGGTVSLFLPDDSGRLIRVAEKPGGELNEKEMSVAAWVFDRGQQAGLGTSTLPAARALYLPLEVPGHRLGVLGVRPEPVDRFNDPGQRQLLETMVGQAAVALERTALADAAREAHLEAEAERLRSSLLSSLSHDTRTPLAAIQGAASALLQGSPPLATPAQRELGETILEESRRMDRMVANLLDVIRLESGQMRVQAEWAVLEDVAGTALLRLRQRLQDHPVTTSFPADLPLVPVDELLLEQAFVNLLENAARHTPTGTPVEIGARAGEGEVEVWVADRGPGLPPGGEARIFEKFQRGESAATGVGLGLTIVRGIILAHGGRIRAEQRPGGGAIVRFTLPVAGAPPPLPSEAEVAT